MAGLSDDSPLYTGVDGMFGNEEQDDSVKEQISEQERVLQELTPQLQDILDMIESEKQLAIQFIADTVDSSKDSDDLLRAELKAAARYRKYLDGLKTQFTLKLNKAKGQ